MNTCPVYRRSGGHSYGTTVPGPIGSILAPARDGAKHHSLPFACSLCGSCTDVCPVKIDLHHQLLTMRRELLHGGHLPWSKRLAMQWGSWFMQSPWRFAWMGRAGRAALRWLPRWLIYHRANAWGRQRELPVATEQSFRDWYRKNRRTADNASTELDPAAARGRTH
jgi:L-lactate dehydrogenase complex protein LldF